VPPRRPLLKPAAAAGIEQNEKERKRNILGQRTRHGAQDASNSVKDCSMKEVRRNSGSVLRRCGIGRRITALCA
jgi:hypothetical protein